MTGVYNSTTTKMMIQGATFLVEVVAGNDRMVLVVYEPFGYVLAYYYLVAMGVAISRCTTPGEWTVFILVEWRLIVTDEIYILVAIIPFNILNVSSDTNNAAILYL